MWDYPRKTPTSEQVDLVASMDIQDPPNRPRKTRRLTTLGQSVCIEEKDLAGHHILTVMAGCVPRLSGSLIMPKVKPLGRDFAPAAPRV